MIVCVIFARVGPGIRNAPGILAQLIEYTCVYFARRRAPGIQEFPHSGCVPSSFTVACQTESRNSWGDMILIEVSTERSQEEE